MNYPKKDKEIMMKNTSKGSKQLVDLIITLATPRARILDFGCGIEKGSLDSDIQHLKDSGFKRVDYHDFNYNTKPQLGKYDFIYADTVLNTIPTDRSLHLVLVEIASYLSPTGIVFLNYPRKRKMNMGNLTMRAYIEDVFAEVFTLTSDKQDKVPIWSCRVEEFINETS